VRRCRPRDRPLVFAHRGGAALAPENTLAAFDHSAELGVDGFELDVRLSKDGKVVVIHDADVARTTGTSGAVSDFTASQLAQLDAGFTFASDDRHPFRGSGLGVRLLADVLLRHSSLPFIVELKGTDVALANAAVAVVAGANALDRVCFGGFSDAMLRAARAADPRVCTSAAHDDIRRALYRSYVYWPIGHPAYAAFQVPEIFGTTRVVSRRFVKAAHRARRLVQVWTVNDVADMRRLIEWGVDALITDRPDLALEVVGAPRPARAPVPAPAGARATAPGR
jgi:glycerophosphoryl diester phosphodiesterase